MKAGSILLQILKWCICEKLWPNKSYHTREILGSVMAKRSQRRPVRYERDQSGCMWGLISMLDFRQGRPNQKLISDKRRGSRNAAGANAKKKLVSPDENCQGTPDSVESTPAAATNSGSGKPSVKKLLEEEMFSEKNIMETKNVEAEIRRSNSELGDQKKKNHRRTRNRSRTKSCELPLESFDAIEGLESEQPRIQERKKKSSKSLDIDELMEEFCQQIHQKGISCTKHDQKDELHLLNHDSVSSDEKMREAIKFIIEKLISGKHLGEDENLHPSKEIRDALQVLSSDEEFLMKILQGPKSIMAKYVQNLWSVQGEKDEDTKSLAGSNLSEMDLKQSDEVVSCKQRKFFRRKSKSGGKIPATGDQESQTSNRIVILKPGPACIRNSDTDGSLGLPPESEFIVRNKGPMERISSHFFLAEIKRKLRHAMGKERQGISADGTSNRFPNKGFKENPGRNSPNKDHFFIERIVKLPMGVKKRGKSANLDECELGTEDETTNHSCQQLSNIYIEAKKHLSEIVSSETGDADTSGREAPKTLGRILSLPEYNSSPVGSPGKDWEQRFVTAQMTLSVHNKFQKQDEGVCCQGPSTSNVETQSSVSDDRTDNEAQIPRNPDTNPSAEPLHDKETDKTSCNHEDEATPEGDVELANATEIVIQEERNSSDSLSESSVSCLARDDENGDIPEVSDANDSSTCLKRDPDEESQPPSPTRSPSTSSPTNKFNDLEGPPEIPDRPSPISVLEPLFTEEDVSPASTRTRPVEPPVQPLTIRFEEHDSPSLDISIHLKACTEDKKPVFEFVKVVLQVSGVSWDEFYIRSHSSEQLLDPSVLVEVESYSSQLCADDRKLLFDLINEVLRDVYGSYFGCLPGLAFLKPSIRPIPDMKSAICEVWEEVCWHLLPLPLPRTLDQIVKRDMSKTGTWMDLRYDAENIFSEIGDAIFDDLIEDTWSSCANEIAESENPLVPAELEEKDSSINL
ncbi:hypothetical protein Tsubulata_007899 [Turnera subulata]|uniref:DUF4378 domain-containing protein n=1 Tax=Turnera subulata TaxID=218843 RepID=A0A9Q0JAF8_9ROSI|nr:hypothetical protein Tsubulata_007899 [Turnera subulata]